MRDFEAEYGVDDGYVGNGKQRFDIPSDVIDVGMTDKELAKIFWEEIQEHFQEHVSPYSDQEDKFIEWAKEVMVELAEDY